MKKIYISGPMSGITEFNHPEFFNAERKLKRLDYCCTNPARLGIKLEAEHRRLGKKPPEWEDYMSVCLPEIPHCHEIYLLKGWENSRGAYIEFINAKLFGLKVRFQ